MKVYISGVVASGDAFESTKEAFSKAERFLNESGFPNVVNPVDNLNPKESENYLRGRFAMNLKKLISCDAIYLMSGWWQSTTATIERYTAKTLGKRILYENDKDKLRIDELIEIIGDTYNVNMADILSKSRVANCVACREHIAHYLDNAGIKHKAIGDSINRNRSSVVHLLHSYDIDSRNNKDFKIKREIIENKLNKRGFFQRDDNYINPF